MDLRALRRRLPPIVLAALLPLLAPCIPAQPVQSVLSLAQKEKPALLDTLRELVSIESGSADREGLDRIAELIVSRLKALGGRVEMVEPGPEVYRMSDTPERIGRVVRATFTGTGTKKILLIAHMDTVYPRGMLAQARHPSSDTVTRQ